MAKIKGSSKPQGPNPYTTQINVGASSSGQAVGYLAPSSGIGPHTGVPAHGYASSPPLAPGAVKAVADYHAARSRAATGTQVSPSKPANGIKH
jgi:hypothetical protein